MDQSLQENIPYITGFMGIVTLMALASYGSCHGMAQAATASTLYIQKKSILTSALVAVIMVSIIFFLALIISILIMNNMEKEYSLAKGIRHLIACLIFGSVGAALGSSMGQMSSSMFRILHKKKAFFFSFMLIFSTAELAVVLAFLIALTLIYN